MATQVNSTSSLIPFTFKDDYQTPDVLLNIFSYLPPEDLRSAVQVCRTWKNIGNDQKLWKNILPKNHWDNFAPLVQKELLNWSQVPQFMKLSSFFEEVRNDNFSEWDFILGNNNSTNSFTHGNTRFEIFQGRQIKVLIESEEAFFLEKLLQIQPGIIDQDQIAKLSVDGPFLFALWSNGTIDQWNIEEKEIVKTISTSYEEKMQFTFPDDVTMNNSRFSVQNGYIFIQYAKSPILEVIPYEDPSKAQTFNDPNLDHAKKIILRKGLVYVIGRSIVTIYDLNKQKILKPIKLSISGPMANNTDEYLIQHLIGDASIFNNRLLTSSTNGRLQVFDLTNGKLLQTHKLSKFFDHSLLFEDIVFGVSGTSLEVVNVKNGKIIASLDKARPYNKIIPIALEWMVQVAKQQSNKSEEPSQAEEKVVNCVTKVWQNVLEVAASCFV